MKRAMVYRRGGRYLVHAQSKTTDGVWIVWEPAFAVPAEGGFEELGRRIVSALDGSRSGVPHPRDWKAVVGPLLALGGVKSWGAFAKSAACVEVEEEGDRIALIPTRNLGTRGFVEQESAKRRFTTREDPDRLGALATELLNTFTWVDDH